MPFRIHPPRSLLTTSFFSTTAIVSFLVVGVPHIIPCPAEDTGNNRLIADDGTPRPARKGRMCPMPRPSSSASQEGGGRGEEAKVIIVKAGDWNDLKNRKDRSGGVYIFGIGLCHMHILAFWQQLLRIYERGFVMCMTVADTGMKSRLGMFRLLYSIHS